MRDLRVLQVKYRLTNLLIEPLSLASLASSNTLSMVYLPEPARQRRSLIRLLQRC